MESVEGTGKQSESCVRYRPIFSACCSVHFPQEEFHLVWWTAAY